MLEFKQEGDILSAAIDYWLSGNVADVPISWQSIVEVLESDYVGEAGRAQKIKDKCCLPEKKGKNYIEFS